MSLNRGLLGLSVALIAGGTAPALAADAATAVSAAPESSTFNITQYTQYEIKGLASTQFNALIQGWAVGNETTTAKDQNVRLRRSELKLSGQILDAPKYGFMVDPAKLIVPPGGKSISADNMVQEFYLSYGFLDGFEVIAGQFKIPTTAEGLDSSSDLPLPERSVVGRAFGDKREMGVKLAYKTRLWSVGSMLSTGRSIQAAATGPNTFNDLDTRIEVTPIKNLAFGTFAVIGNNFDYSKKGRWGINGRYRLGDAVLRSEYSLGKDLGVHSQGITNELGYWITERFEPVARFEMFSPNQSFAAGGKAETLGVNYYFRDYFTKVQLSGSLLQDMAAVNGSPAVVKGADNKEITLELQAAI